MIRGHGQISVIDTRQSVVQYDMGKLILGVFRNLFGRNYHTVGTSTDICNYHWYQYENSSRPIFKEIPRFWRIPRFLWTQRFNFWNSHMPNICTKVNCVGMDWQLNCRVVCIKVRIAKYNIWLAIMPRNFCFDCKPTVFQLPVCHGFSNSCLSALNICHSISRINLNFQTDHCGWHPRHFK